MFSIIRYSGPDWVRTINAALPVLDKDSELSMLASVALRNCGDRSKRAMDVEAKLDRLSRSADFGDRLFAAMICRDVHGWLAPTKARLAKDPDWRVRTYFVSSRI